MKATAKLKYLRIAPRKVRMVSNLIRGKKVEEAQTILQFALKKGSLPILKLLQSAVASAKHNFHAREGNLYISKISVDEGPKLKRVMAMSRGQAYPMFKRTSHIFIELSEIAPQAKVQKTEKVQELKQETPTAMQEKTREFAKVKARPTTEVKVPMPKIVRGAQRIFRRKVI